VRYEKLSWQATLVQVDYLPTMIMIFYTEATISEERYHCHGPNGPTEYHFGETEGNDKEMMGYLSAGLLNRQDAEDSGPGHRLGAVVHVELTINVTGMPFDRVGGKKEAPGHFAIR